MMRLCDNIRLGPKPPWADPKWIEEGNRLAEAMIAAAKQELEKTMHYRNGREAKNGDRVVSFGNGGGSKIEAVGILVNAVPGNDHCNGQVVTIHGWSNGTATVTGACLCDCLHADDVEALLKEKGLDKRPAGK